MSKKILTIFFFLFVSTFIYAQQITVSGVVSDASEIPIPGVNVKVKGKTTGTTTDFDGNYEIQAAIGDTLVFSNVSYGTNEVQVLSAVQNVTMAEGNQLDEVVITAFGIKKSFRELGYSITQVNAEDLQLAGQTNAITALQGRVAGVQINQSSGTSGGGVDILIRGVTSIDPSRNNQPLIIVDGLALNNDTFSGNVLPSVGSNSPSSKEQFSFTNRAADINPEDIESFSILKGAAATALYGIRAANGAIIITTKRGKLGKAKVSINASTTIRQIKKTPELQKTYREGFLGIVDVLYTPETESGFTRVNGTATPFHTWGPKYSDDSVVNPNGDIIDLTNDRYYDPYELFRSGINSQLNFSISGATDKIDYFLSAGQNTEEGVLPNTDYDRTNFRLKAGYKVTNNFDINTSIAYTKSGGKKANQGDRSVFSSLSFFSPTFPINDYVNADGTNRNYTPFIDNPRNFLENSVLKDDVNRWIGNAKFNWAPKDWINITYAAQVDNYSDQRNRFVPPYLDTALATGGFIVEQDINFIGLESNLLVTLTKDFSDDLGATFTVGNQISDLKTDATTLRGEGLNVPNINDIFNTVNKFGNVTTSQVRNTAVFGEFKLDYLNKLFLTVTGRNDWVSTLPKDNRSFFYPSFSLAYDIKDLFGDNNALNFGKFRASWAEVGKGPVFGSVGRFFVAGDVFPFDGTGGFQISSLAGDIDLKPEKTQSFEVGVDLRFFNNRLRLDYAYFNSKTNDQIIPLPVAVTSGISRFTVNAGDYKTFGHEILLSGDIIKNDNFKWETTLNYSTNEGEILSLPDDFESIVFADSGFAGVTSEVQEGDKIGTLYGWKWRYENGERYIGDDGLPRVDFDSGRQKVGNAFPDFIASMSNNFRYKNFGLNFLVEWKEGGDLYDSGRRNSIRNGLLKLTEFRNETTVLSGVKDDGNGGFVTNDQEVFIDQNYYRSSTRYNRASEVIVQDASWVKLRNLGLSYNIDGNVLKTIGMDSFSITGSVNNILIWTPFEGFDPEGSQYSSGSNVYGFTGLSTPISESYTIGIKLGF